MTYVPSAIIGCSRRISVSIKGFCDFVLKKGESRTVELDDGEYIVVLRGYFTKRRVKLMLQGDDSFYVTWDYSSGGITIVDSFDGGAASNQVLRIWAWLLVALFLGPYAALLVMMDREILSSDAYYPGLLILAVATIASLLLLFKVRAKDISR